MTKTIKWEMQYLHPVTYNYKQWMRENRNVNPLEIFLHLKPAHLFVQQENWYSRCVRMWLQTEHKIRPLAMRVVVESSIHGSFFIKLVQKTFFLKFQYFCHGPQDLSSNCFSFPAKFMQNIPERTWTCKWDENNQMYIILLFCDSSNQIS